MPEPMLFQSLEPYEAGFAVRGAPPATPATRFQGSKLKLLPWLHQIFKNIPCERVLDGFGGSGCVSHFLKTCGKTVVFNDRLQFAYTSAKGLVKNSHERLSKPEVDYIVAKHPDRTYDDFIARTFEGIYFTDEENAWLDVAVQNAQDLDGPYKQAIALHSIFQAALIKRPYNLFHRRNLYMRLAEVERSFGNKKTWDTPFDTHFRAFVDQANSAVFDSGKQCGALNSDILEVTGDFDLVYLDPPYINGSGVGTDYFGFYHFLDGICDYRGWESRIDFDSKHRRLKSAKCPWTQVRGVHGCFRDVIDKFRKSTIAISYRSDGVPSPEEIAAMLRDAKKTVVVHRRLRNYKYALSKNGDCTEMLFIGSD